MLIQATSSIFLPHGLDIRPFETAFANRGISFDGGGVPGRFDSSLPDRIYSDPQDIATAHELIARAIRKGGAHVVGSSEIVIVKHDATLPALPGSDRPIQQSRKKVKESSVSETLQAELG
jgi:hypothetical protein